MNWLALDVGGAHIKVANGRGFAAAYPFPLWKNPEGLHTNYVESSRNRRNAITWSPQ